MDDITSKGREAIKGKEVEASTAAGNYFGREGDLHAAGLATAEQGGAYELLDQTDEALGSFVAASNLFKQRLGVVYAKGNPNRHSAEVDVLVHHLIEAQMGVLRIMQAKDKVKDEDKELLKAAVYDLDDHDAPQERVLEAYELLASSSHFREKRFYKKELARVAGYLAGLAAIENGAGVAIIGFASTFDDRSHLRPAVNLPAVSSAQ